ncbi:MAG: DMT family transporter [Anaerolineales bacterium]|nr:DMT family transporter [Anaerolineales bacterium]
MLFTLYGLGAAITWGVGSILIKTQVGRLNSGQLLALRALAGAVTAVMFTLLLNRSFVTKEVSLLTWFAVLGTVLSGYFAADLLFVRALEGVPLSVALPIQATYPLVTAGLAWIIFGEPPTLFVVIGALVVVMGIAFIGGSSQEEKMRGGSSSIVFRWNLILVGLSALGWGVSAILLSFVLRSVDAIAANSVVAVLVLLAFLASLRQRVPWSFMREYPTRLGVIFLAGALGGTGISNLLFILAVESGGVTQATALVCTAPLFAAIFAVLFLGEKMTSRLAAGTLLTVFGIWFIVGG